MTTLPILISFDIDGTLEVGEPQGSITMDFVRAVSRRGCIVGSCSDRPISFQKRLWSQHDIAVDFTALKQNLDEVKSRFAAAAYIHIGDTEVDEYFAIQSGFRFIEVDTMEWREWSVRVLQMESER
ncbi:MAG: HAD family hydrolase [Chloroflexi bacterium]|nr:HAD family hydrolase [Chloroflexota bacterium]